MPELFGKGNIEAVDLILLFALDHKADDLGMGNGDIRAIAAVLAVFAGLHGHHAVAGDILIMLGDHEGNAHHEIVPAALESGGKALHIDAVVGGEIFQFYDILLGGAQLAANGERIGLFIPEDAIPEVDEKHHGTANDPRQIIKHHRHGGAAMGSG